MIREKQRSVNSGWGIVGILLAIDLAALYGIYLSVEADNPAGIMTSIVVAVLAALMYPGLFIVNLNEGKVLQLFGAYKGTVREEGLRWANPLYSKKRVSLPHPELRECQVEGKRQRRQPDRNRRRGGLARVRHRGSGLRGARLRELPARADGIGRPQPRLELHLRYSREERGSLRGHTGAVAEHLKREIQDRLSKAGIEVLEARITHLAYAPEIAAAMLQRQQAGAIIAARQRIVEGAVGMVQMALDMLSQRGIVQLDDERKAAMVSNLLVVLCGERGTQPIVNAGTITSDLWLIGNPFCCASIARCSTRSSAGRTTTCAA